MKRTLALLPALALAAAVAVTAIDTRSVSAGESSGVVHAKANGCDITFKAENKSLKNIYVVLEDSEVRTKQMVAGPWSKLENNCPVENWKIPSKGGVKSTTCELDLVCDLKRQYKFRIEERSENGNNVINAVWVYFPAEDDWVDAGTKTINLGNVGRHF